MLKKNLKIINKIKKIIIVYIIIMFFSSAFIFNVSSDQTDLWWNTGWLYRKEIKIDHTKVNAGQTNFPILINLPSDTNLAAHAQPDGDDIVFTDVNRNKLNHEIELYENNNGRLIAWVNIPTISSTTDTQLYMYYGNNNCNSQQNPQNTWNNDYLMVHHMEESGNIYDSTSHALNAINHGTATETNGKIGGCRYFNSTSDYYDFGASDMLNPGMNSWTITLWTKISFIKSHIMLRKWSSNKGFHLTFYNGVGGTNYFMVGDGTKTTYKYWNTVWTDGTWHYITIVINRDTNKLDVYLDGNLKNGVGTGDITGFNSITTTSKFYLYGGADGRHDEFTISTKARDSNWIKTSYNNQNNPSTFYSIGNQEMQSSPPPTIPTLKWSKTSGVGVSVVGSVAADVNNDGKIEIIKAWTSGITVRDGKTGTLIWKKSVKMFNEHCPIEIIDLNKDGILEIISSHENGTWALHGNDGSVYWYNQHAPLDNKYCVAGDINADGYPEVFVCTQGKITALTHDGQIFASKYVYYPCFGGLSLGDTDHDGVYELYLNERSANYPPNNNVGEGVIAYWASNLTKRWSHPEMLSSSHCPTLVDVDKDGKLDVVSLQQSGGGIYVFNSTNGNIIRGSLIPNLKCHSQPTIYDIDQDGNLELIACRDWSKPIIWDLYTWKLDTMLPYACLEPPAIADIDGDGYVEILASTKDNISIFNHNYQFIGSINLTNPDLYGMSMILAQDVDNDGLTELIINRVSTIYVYDTIAPSPTPRALSQFNFYSQHRGRSPYYVEYN